MSIKQIRNYNYFPEIYEEGFFAAAIREPPVKEDKKKAVWHKGLEPYARLFSHHTLSSARRHANFINIKSLISRVKSEKYANFHVNHLLISDRQKTHWISFSTANTIIPSNYSRPKNECSPNQKLTTSQHFVAWETLTIFIFRRRSLWVIRWRRVE